MPLQHTPDDALGLTHEARAGANRGLCLDLLLALNDDLVAQVATSAVCHC